MYNYRIHTHTHTQTHTHTHTQYTHCTHTYTHVHTHTHCTHTHTLHTHVRTHTAHTRTHTAHTHPLAHSLEVCLSVSMLSSIDSARSRYTYAKEVYIYVQPLVQPSGMNPCTLVGVVGVWLALSYLWYSSFTQQGVCTDKRKKGSPCACVCVCVSVHVCACKEWVFMHA